MRAMSGATKSFSRLELGAWVAVGLSALALSATSIGCGGSSSSSSPAVDTPADASAPDTAASDDSSSPDAAADVAVDAAPMLTNGAPSTTYPAFPIDVAQIKDYGGTLLTSPVIVTITWSTDTLADTYNAFGDTIGASPYWHAINSEYGIGPATSGTANHVSITTPPPSSYEETALDTLVDTSAGTTWPAPTSNTIYAVYLPPGVSITQGGQDQCAVGIGGYHSASKPHGYVYAIVPHCNGSQAADIELAASHELNEASTDPLNHGTSYYGFDNNHLAFEFYNSFQQELGDACEFFDESIFADRVDFTPYTVQRQWSNKSAAAGSHWCVPALPEPWFNTTFLASSNLDTINVNLSSLGNQQGSVLSKGLKMDLGTTRTFPIGFFSDAATSGPFSLSIQGQGEIYTTSAIIPNGTATITIDKTSGVNGEIANVTVTPTAYNAMGIIFFDIEADLPGSKESGVLPVLISKQ